ncbi:MULTISPECIES: GerMN domain-containing protein [unclassified Clostridioides]|uniref:GerMN domain-containing protein n=1 Tax=unclassified Clostridioides TaxID=2635829 RepID=UPI001D10B4F3|nr:GerMN domain-containing protein [Clostridioides sp. ZZV14-6150]MCC0669940.1 GerMN domain-containing protein [Clostridioides sp. ZZV14-6153]MCC0724098.1 GerMN domain-containing protein [Clostridioides sp. ZZV14-6104]MCC0726172.1 GerMN domain-containing protein [Clostridioides sp. ZZV14-6045]MCC0730795.1 GerMN domain-containing protein [Clostridioides sp. ZZV14-6048]MCC0735853.1 GerMN domain-containing protein [Clostridioides sp. ZZV14-6009]MCC0743673.1 GerMN domain-containing protein [Clost
MKNKKIMLVLSILSISILAVGCSNAQNEATKKETKNNTNVEQPKEENNNENNDEKEVPNKKSASTPKEEKKTESAVIYSFDVDKTDLIENKVNLEKIDENTLFAELQKLKVIPESAKLNSFTTKDIDGVKTGILDVNSDFTKSNLGSDAETLMLDSVARTYIKNMNVEQIKLTVDGANYESGHIVLEDGDYLK